jgi:putative tryptophan/tyrosine transport system substrate-binding protein
LGSAIALDWRFTNIKRNMRYKATAFLLIILTATPLAEAQRTPKAVPRIGFIISSGNPSSPQLEAFRLGLRDLGYVDGKNILIERRYAEGRLDRMSPFVHEFVEQKVDVIIGVNNVVIRAAMEATKTIPIVLISSIDPVAAGYVESFANPSGNITGLAWLIRDLSAKRLEFLKELLPRMSRVGVLWDADGPGPAIALKEYEVGARAFKLEFHSFEIRAPNPDLAGAFRAAKTAHVDALIVVANPLMGQFAKQVFELGAKYRLPSMTEERRYVDAGGLMSYGANVSDLYRRAATYVDKILKGAKPTDLPVEAPNQFELVVNHRTAKQIGLAIPPSLSVRADK